jgi:hypothetical protein
MAEPTAGLIPPIPITAEDKFSKVFDQLRARASSTFKDVSGSVRDASDAGRKLGEAFEPFAKMAGASGVLGGGLAFAGALEGLQKFANTGAEIGRSAARIGIGTTALQQIGQVAYMLGGQATTGAQAMEALQVQLGGAASGRDGDAVAFFKEFEVSVGGGTRAVTRAIDALPKLREGFKTVKDPIWELIFATKAFGPAGREFLEVLRLNDKEFDEWMKKTHVIGPAGIAAADDFQKAARTLEVSVGGIGNTLGERYAPALTEAMHKTTDWLNELQKSPAGMKAVEVGADTMGVALVGLTGATTLKLVGATASWATGFSGAALAANAFAAALGRVSIAGAAITGILELIKWGREAGVITGQGGAQWDPAWGPRPKDWQGPKSEDQPSDTIDRILNPVRRFFGLKTHGAAADIARPSPSGLAAASGGGDNLNTGIDFFMRKGLSREQATGVVARLAEESGGGKQLDPNAVNPSSGAYGIGQWLGNRKPGALATGGDLNKQLELVWSEFQTTEAAAFQKIQAARTAGDAAMAMEAFERAGNPSFTQRAASTANRLFGIGSANAEIARSPFQPEARAGFSDAQLRGQFADYQKMMVGSKLSGGTFEQWREMMYPGGASPSAPPANTEPATGPRFLPDVPDYSGALDSNHRVSIDINGMPQGGRARLLESSGPAKLQLRVQQAMSSP